MVSKISIIGSGAVGSGLAYNLLSRRKLEDLILVDISVGLAKGVALDLEDTRGFLNFSTRIHGTDSFEEIKDSQIIVITAGAARKVGMTRLDLLRINAEVARDVSVKIKKLASEAIVIIVTNPLDFITYVTARETGFSRNKVLGMGSSLDTSRWLNLIFEETGVVPSDLEGFVYGLHSKDMIVSCARMKARGKPLSNLLKSEKIGQIEERVRLRGAEIVGYLKNKSAHFAPSLSVACLIDAIADNKNELIPVSVFLDGEYGLKDLCMGVPCIINKNGVEKVIEIELSEQEKEEIKKVKDNFEKAKAENLI